MILVVFFWWLIGILTVIVPVYIYFMIKSESRITEQLLKNYLKICEEYQRYEECKEVSNIIWLIHEGGQMPSTFKRYKVKNIFMLTPSDSIFLFKLKTVQYLTVR